jgi:ribosomal protein S18 acetylase RimI-like enzyme
VATHPASQGQGIGRQLVADAIHYAAGVGAAGVSLNTQQSNIVSRHLYEALGFRPTGGVLSVMVRRG